MLRVREDHITWGHEDVRMMSKIIGSEHAVIHTKQSIGRMPLLMSVLKLAQRKGLPLSARATRILNAAESHYRVIERLKQEHFEITDRRVKKYFRHQRDDLGLLYSVRPSGVLIAHEAGVGKTLPAIRYSEHVDARRIMVVVPNAAKEQWADEITRWSTSKLPIIIVGGTVAQQIEQIRRAKTGWVIGHWESLVHARLGWLSRPWDAVVLDEVQHIQNRNAGRTLTVHKLRANFRMALSAHPYANGVSELFPVLKFLYPEVYTSFWRWAQIHIEIEEGVFGGLDLRTPRRPKLLQWEIAPFTLRRLWKDVWKNLPPITRSYRTATLTNRGRAEYKRLKKQFFVELAAHDGETNILAIPSVLARITRLRQYLIDPGILGAKEPSVKYPIVRELMEELGGERRPVIFSMYRKAAERLQVYLAKKKLNVGLVVGGMGSEKINAIKHRFVRGRYDAVIILIQVGGTSLNFGKYGSIVYLDHPWNQRDVEQSEGRVRRPEEGTGRLVPATSYHIIVKDSYEERMYQTRAEKHMDFSRVFTVAQARELFDEED